MNKIPTAEKLFEQKNPQDGILPEWAKDLMIEFAKLHVRKALQAASKVLDVDGDGDYVQHPTPELILFAYPLTNIK